MVEKNKKIVGKKLASQTEVFGHSDRRIGGTTHDVTRTESSEEMESNKQPVASATTTGRRTTWVALGFFVTVVAVVATVMLAAVGGFLGDTQVGTSIRRRLGEVASSAELKLAFKVNEVYGK